MNPRRLVFFLGCLVLTGLPAGPLHAQSVPPKGTDATFDVATWNIEWFGDPQNGPSDDPLQLANVQAVIEQAAVDLWAVQEIADPDDFDALLAGLGSTYAGLLATESGTQRIGFIYKTGLLRPRNYGHILTDFASDFAGRPPLQLEADITLGDTTLTVTFITVHMKAFSDLASYERRLQASQRLKNRLDFLLPGVPVIVLGDFNDELLNSITPGRPSPYDNFVQDPDDYFFPTLALEAAGQATFCSSSTCAAGSTIDHILITDELVPHYVPGSAERYEALLDALGSYTVTTSDHLPVVARFDFARATTTRPIPGVPDGPALTAAPHPFRDRTTLSFTLARTGAVRLAVYDTYGREVARLVDRPLPAGFHRVDFDAAGRPSGLYMVYLRTPNGQTSRPLLHVR
ncbi:endonuclease/exonuclease/phosphatase family protein [Rhodocaloribacter litoris]|uniref:endonuclease/exonuclease/phosphatase family protein n=1 Tax=Rhodocaloribacter litoris TaxID=2558931 RepID=UPI00141F1708|nr:endonuclease/exonuclease/phosphatase family protein [Rhodocaloribacter litoris]QXD15179.1 endonuclease/exonuclease/phosphatase family protein [Rhodocaloribacter litoris]